MPSILMVCTANLFRSPIAAALLEREIDLQDNAADWIVRSAGTWTNNGAPVPPITLQVGKSLNIHGLQSHRTRQVDEQLLAESDLIIVMESNHKEAIQSEFADTKGRIFVLPEIVVQKSYDIPDPTLPGVDAESVANELNQLITTGTRSILEKATVLESIKHADH